MITKMKKLTFLVYHKEYEPFLERLRELGVVHVVERQRGGMDDTLQQFMQKRATYKNVLSAMYLLAGKQPDAVQAQGVAGDALLARYEKMQADIQALEQRLPALDKDVAQFDVWGDFSWQDIARLLPLLVEKGGIYNVCDTNQPSFGELERLIARQLGKRKPMNIPYGLAKALAWIGDCMGKHAPINSMRLKKITDSLTFSNEKAVRELGWQPLDVLEHFRIS